MRFSRTFILGAIAIALLSGALLAQDIPLNNWTVPPYTASASRGGITTMTDSTPPRLFIGIQPCRVTDTRGNGAPIQGGIFANGESRTWDVTNICGIPAGADAISANFTVTGSPAAPPGAFILAWPTGGPVPPVSILNFQAGQTIANAAIVPLGASEQINVNVSHSTHILMDVNGYFSDTLQNGSNFLRLDNNSTGFTAYFDNNSTVCNGPCGVYAETSSGHAVYGAALDAVPGSVGVLGHSTNYNGVWGESVNQDGIAGFGGRDGAYLQGARHGVIGVSVATSGVTYGVFGVTASASGLAAGVFGAQGTLAPFGYVAPVGVLGRADDNNTGVVGTAENANGWGVQGFRLNQTTGASVTSGVLGYAGNSGVHSFQDVTAGGLKPFVVPYDGDAGKQIVFVAIEADEALTATRGRTRLDRGIGRIRVPGHFLRVTEPEGWSVQLTPIGEMASVAVVRIDPQNGEVTVMASRSVDVFYRIEGVRKGYADFKPVQENVLFVPQSASSTMPPWPESTKALLIKNGIFQENGTVNLETAHRLGWDVNWGNAARPAPRPENPAAP